jgi:mRNA-degrading endonuclease RelE of RelBE toxin-antitoxin system
MVTKPFRLVYAPDIRNQLLAIDRKYLSLIRQSIEEQLSYEPDIKTTNRKPLKFSSKFGEWELRFGPKNRFRVIYRFSVADSEVYIGAIGEKRGNRFYVGGEEVKL